MTTPPNPAMIREIQSRIAQGWTVEVVGYIVQCVAEDGATFGVECASVEDADALLAAASV